MLNGIDGQRIAKTTGTEVLLKSISGAKIEDIYDPISLIIPQIKPDIIIIHAGTNNARLDTSSAVINKLLWLKSYIVNNYDVTNVFISLPTTRSDDGKACFTIRNINQKLIDTCDKFVDNRNISQKHLGVKGLHLNKKGKNLLCSNFINLVRLL